ncbi:MAG: glycosyltransferase family 2 protein [Candidatus Omnitrophica bacterium]|nr:glycosyltransferase family 2 protein [Candidatus Omnitrophota bacterium]
MKIAAVYCVYNEEEYLEYSLRSIYPFVEKIVILLGMAPWTANNPSARNMFVQRDRTEAIVDRLAQGDPKFVIRKGLWDSDVEQREVGMQYCVEQGMDYYFLVDGDEIYREDHLQAIRDEIEQHPEVGTFHIKCTVLWRSFQYRIPYWGVQWIPWRIFQVTRFRRVMGLRIPYQCRFIGPEKTNSLGPRRLIPPHKAIFYHLGYARSEQRMRLKIATGNDQDRYIKGWFDTVWLAWPNHRSMKNLQQLYPEGLPEALYVEPSDLPQVLRDHPYWGRDIIS